MIKCIIKAVKREHACLLYTDNLAKFDLNQTFIALSNNPAKKYSFLVKIIEKKKVKESKQIILEIDSRRLGPISNDDLVFLYNYNIPSAEKIVIGVIDEDYPGIPSGDWTATLKPHLKGKILDFGDIINLAVEYEVDVKKNIMLIRGMLLESTPNPPILVEAKTICEIKKLIRDDYQTAKNKIEEEKVSRSDEFLKFGEETNRELIAQLKSGDFEKASESFHFKHISGKSLNSLIEGAFTGFSIYKENISDDGMTYTCSRIYVIKEQGIPKQILEYQLASFELQGSVILNSYSESLEKSSEIAKNLISDIEKLHLSLKKRPLITGYCPDCGEKVPIGSFDGNVIICEYCGKDIHLSD